MNTVDRRTAEVVTKRGSLGDFSYFALRIGDSVFQLPSQEYHRILATLVGKDSMGHAYTDTEGQALHPLMFAHFQSICDQFNPI